MSADIDADGHEDILLSEYGTSASVSVLRAGYCTMDTTCNGVGGICTTSLYYPVRSGLGLAVAKG